MPRPGRPGASRGKKKGPTVGTGGHGRKALEGRGPTPKAEDREYHTAHKRKAAAERAAAKSGGSPAPRVRAPRREPGEMRELLGVEALQQRLQMAYQLHTY